MHLFKLKASKKNDIKLQKKNGKTGGTPAILTFIDALFVFVLNVF